MPDEKEKMEPVPFFSIKPPPQNSFHFNRATNSSLIVGTKRSAKLRKILKAFHRFLGLIFYWPKKDGIKGWNQ